MISRLRTRYLGSTEEPLSEDQAAEALRNSVRGDITTETDPFVTDSCLHRYLRARNYDVEKARRMLQSTLTWRASYQPDSLATREVQLLRNESETGKMYVLPKADAMNRAVIVMRPGKENSHDTRGKIANLVYTLERAARTANEAGGQQFVVIVDYAVGEISASTLPSLSVSRETTNILQGHYPERLSCMVLVQAPRLFHSMFKIIRPLIDAKTREKVHFVSSPSDVVTVPDLDRDSIPSDYGGTLDWKFDVDKYFEETN